jgi:predicted PurR-regulated permease PerM
VSLIGIALVIASIDKILRPSLIPKGAQLNPALVLLSVIGSLRIMGITLRLIETK